MNKDMIATPPMGLCLSLALPPRAPTPHIVAAAEVRRESEAIGASETSQCRAHMKRTRIDTCFLDMPYGKRELLIIEYEIRGLTRKGKRSGLPAVRPMEKPKRDT